MFILTDLISCLRACLQWLRSCFSCLLKTSELLEVIMLNVLDNERRERLAYEDGRKGKEAISLRLRSLRSSRTWKPTCDMEIRLHRELGSISRRILGSHRTVGSVLVQSLDLKHQDKTVSACHSGSSTMFQTNFSNHYTLLSRTKLSFQIILSINFSLLLLTVTLLSLNTHPPSGICSTLFHLIV